MTASVITVVEVTASVITIVEVTASVITAVEVTADMINVVEVTASCVTVVEVTAALPLLKWQPVSLLLLKWQRCLWVQGMQLHRQAAEERLANNNMGQSFLARQRQVHSRRAQTINTLHTSNSNR